MISNSYTIGQKQKYGRIKPILVFGNKPQDIVGYTEAISSDELYVPHHILEKYYTMKELKQMNRYDIVPSNELVWLPQSFHNGNREIHKGFENCGCGNRKGHTPVLKPETVEKRKLRSLEAKIEKFNKEREIRLRKVRFELTLNRTDISRQRKNQLIKAIPLRIERKNKRKIRQAEADERRIYKTNMSEFNKLLRKQKRLIKWGDAWWRLEEKLQCLIEKL